MNQLSNKILTSENLLLVPNNVARSKIPWLMQKMIKSNNAMDGCGMEWMERIDWMINWNETTLKLVDTHTLFDLSVSCYTIKLDDYSTPFKLLLIQVNNSIKKLFSKWKKTTHALSPAAMIASPEKAAAHKNEKLIRFSKCHYSHKLIVLVHHKVLC